jgi:hypothetical protein
MNKKALCVLLAPALVVGISTLWPSSRSATAGAPAAPPTQAAAAASAPEAPKVVEPLELQTAVEQGAIKVEFAGNGRQRLDAKLTNLTSGPLKIKAEAGQMLASGKNQIVIVRPVEAEAAAGETIQFSIHTAATRSSNKVADAVYLLSYSQPPRIAALLAHLQTRMELSPGAIQTAVLALTENLPLNAVSKFTPSTVGLKSRFNTDAFRVESYDIVTALTALREIGVPDASVAMTIDPQLKIESMIDPLARNALLRDQRRDRVGFLEDGAALGRSQHPALCALRHRPVLSKGRSRDAAKMGASGADRSRLPPLGDSGARGHAAA